MSIITRDQFNRWTKNEVSVQFFGTLIDLKNSIEDQLLSDTVQLGKDKDRLRLIGGREVLTNIIDVQLEDIQLSEESENEDKTTTTFSAGKNENS